MREIKFRAWEVQTKRMLDWNYFMNISTDYLFGRNGNSIMIPMQYTGIKDKNGKEVYEGDIVDYEDTHNIDDSGIQVIGWDSENAGFGRRYLGEQEFDATCFSEVVTNFEVIGNIYENQELLNNNE